MYYMLDISNVSITNYRAPLSFTIKYQLILDQTVGHTSLRYILCYTISITQMFEQYVISSCTLHAITSVQIVQFCTFSCATCHANHYLIFISCNHVLHIGYIKWFNI